MFNTAYEEGQTAALNELTKVAGVELARAVMEKLAEEEKLASRLSGIVAKGKNLASSAGSKIKGAVSGANENLRKGTTGKSKPEHSSALGKKLFPRKKDMTKTEQAKELAKGVGKYTAAGAGVGGAGYGVYKATESDD